MRWRRILSAGILFVFFACDKNKDSADTLQDVLPDTATPSYGNISVTTDKAAYYPGDEVTFMTDNSSFPASVKVRYKYLNSVLAESSVTTSTWKWKTPTTDYRGYLAEVYSTSGSAETIHSAIAVDVSSDWKKFPRYGFLSKFPQLNDAEINGVINNLNRFHINGLQFYDWQNKHHNPLPVTGSTPATMWKDIINRDIYFGTVQKYISAAHNRNMKAMFYNLIYGAWDNAEADGVQKEWYVYTDKNHFSRDFHPLSSPFLSNIYLLDPSNSGWQQYLKNENKKIYQALDFDGFHMDQLGDRGPRYQYDGTFLNLSLTFKSFIDAVKNSEPQKDIVMNAVAQYGQKGIAESSAGFLYTEVWSPFDSYTDLSNLIQQNNSYSANTKNTVLAAYVNYDLADSKGYFNTASILMTNAVIFAFGGAHLELGEHMLAKEYFPNNNLTMNDELKNALVNYYDFLVAYQNLLRDGGTFNQVELTSRDNKIQIGPWPPSQGMVATFGKKLENTQVIHLINFTNSMTLKWRDSKGTQAEPVPVKDTKLMLTSDVTVKKIWVASPDFIGGASRSLNFVQTANKVSFVLPELEYWTMVVVEY